MPAYSALLARQMTIHRNTGPFYVFDYCGKGDYDKVQKHVEIFHQTRLMIDIYTEDEVAREIITEN